MADGFPADVPFQGDLLRSPELVPAGHRFVDRTVPHDRMPPEIIPGDFRQAAAIGIMRIILIAAGFREAVAVARGRIVTCA